MASEGECPYNATLIAREEVSPGHLVIRVRPDGELFRFQPGQFAVLGLCRGEPRVAGSAPDEGPAPIPEPRKLIRRAYSIASSSAERRYAEYYIMLVSTGELTPRLFNLGINARLFMSPKATGLFTLDQVPADRHVVMVATGTGLAPYMSMLRTHLALSAARRFAVLHGARVSWDLGYRAELETIARLCPNFVYLPAITRAAEDPGFRGHVGRLQTLLADGVVEREARVPLAPDASDVFLCGNPGMIDAAREILVARGFQESSPRRPGNIHTEKYW
ncbi:MAG: ferredoxin--NADP reductase [Planctomycetes bacterium]|nr:ferredoxin--NADP reductase [Planctomycetota bacterium]